MKKKSFKVLEEITESSKDLPKDTSNEPDVLEDVFKENLKGDLHDIANRVREYVKAQKDDWQKAPYLALKCDGISGYSDYLQHIHTYGYIPFTVKSNCFDIFIDCETGDLTTQIFGPHRGEPADDVHCVYLSTRIDSLNAKDFVKGFEDRAKKPLPSYCVEKELNDWQQDQIDRLKLEKIYTRKPRK